MQILMFEFESLFTLYKISNLNGNISFEKVSDISDFQQLDFENNTECIIVDVTASDEPKLSLSLNNLMNGNYKITTNKVTNAIKRINSEGQITEHLDREEYVRLSTPIKATVGMVKKYFSENSEWDFYSFISQNSNFFENYQAVEPEVFLESK
jgi:hypothetical protein